ncbi:unnamed protein product [Medioppia subpectinata]|uniref:AB hydrolase-1 domain-containing protein n=1 Tax=Medioppia subpectinata TaxID=1979941 RepID=A0A7R9KTP2_9ACAR|nr:unnamed protein product [Medioppia subpectinata]CAG2108451.1 unnamed protein product [Medioppia subpectinata]
MTSGKVDINGWPVWYEKFGTGSEVLLLIPGAIGTGRSDFLPQLEGDHAFDQEKYTLVCIELPGWGRSRPPERKYDKNVYNNDADVAFKLMDSLGYKSFSVIGFSEGGKVGIHMCLKNQPRVKGLVLISIFVKITPQTVAPTLATQNTSLWPQEVRDNYVPVYGDEVQAMWDGYINFCKVYAAAFPNGYVTNKLQNIMCPVLLFHGDMDPLCSLDHPLHVEKNVQYCQLHRFKRGAHNCHHKYPAEFMRVTEHFLKDCNDFR